MVPPSEDDQDSMTDVGGEDGDVADSMAAEWEAMLQP